MPGELGFAGLHVGIAVGFGGGSLDCGCVNWVGGGESGEVFSKQLACEFGNVGERAEPGFGARGAVDQGSGCFGGVGGCCEGMNRLSRFTD
mgnify:CR=1 FL=1